MKKVHSIYDVSIRILFKLKRNDVTIHTNSLLFSDTWVVEVSRIMQVSPTFHYSQGDIHGSFAIQNESSYNQPYDI